MKAESKTKDFILFFTEAHPNFLSQREKKLVKAESKTKDFILFFTEAHPNFLYQREKKLVKAEDSDLLSV
ncbi:MAG: hypothetical protein IJK49_08855 [Prevotella sp.]|nr:hypothetical protein [Prevotella sp.]